MISSTQLFRSTSLSFSIILGICVASLSLYDVIRQTRLKETIASISDTTIAVTTYFSVAFISISITLSRYFTVKKALTRIPKAYVPICEDDIPKDVYKSINTEYSRVAIITSLAAKLDRNRQSSNSSSTLTGLEGWGRPGTIHEGKRFRDEILTGYQEFERILNELISKRSITKIPTWQTSQLSPLDPYLHILLPQSATQSTPILLNSTEKQVLKIYKEIVDKAVKPHTVIIESDYEIACKSLLLIVQHIKKVKSIGYKNPVGYGDIDDPVYQGIRFKDAIIETAIRLNEALLTKYGEIPNQSKNPINNLLDRFFPLLYPPHLPDVYGPIITGYADLLSDTTRERTRDEYEYALRCVGLLSSQISSL